MYEPEKTFPGSLYEEGRRVLRRRGSVSQMPPAAIQGGGNSQREWGRKIRDSGKLELWARNLAGKNKVFTFVIRA
jgi:hypothetical protein